MASETTRRRSLLTEAQIDHAARILYEVAMESARTAMRGHVSYDRADRVAELVYSGFKRWVEDNQERVAPLVETGVLRLTITLPEGCAQSHADWVMERSTDMLVEGDVVEMDCVRWDAQ